jgi:transcriptional regulator with PAS, ATPase and Fis domain
VLQEKEVSKIGSEKLLKLDFRLITSSNKNLEQMVASGHFREDLYYRLNVVTLTLPPLRDRAQDLEILALHFLKDLSVDLHTNVGGLTVDAWRALRSHRWKGNIRELRNVLERAMTVCQEKALDARHLSSHLSKREVCITVLAGKSLLLSENLRAAERDTILFALKEAKGNKRKACRILGISRSGLYEKMSSYGLNTNSWKAAVQDGENLSSLDREEIECGTESFDAAN